MLFITDIDFNSNVVFTDSGMIFEIETYVDKHDDPCLVEDSVALYYVTESYTIVRHDYTDEEFDRIKDRFS